MLSIAHLPILLGQDAVLESVTEEAISNAKDVYARAMVDQIHLFEGRSYTVYSSQRDEHPYYYEDWMSGTIFYNGHPYYHDAILYDIFRDQVIVRDFYGGNWIQLISEKVDYFILNDHKFARIENAGVKDGFYDQLVEGEIKFYVSRSKEFVQEVSSAEIKNKFEGYDRYYLFRNETFYRVKNKRSLLTILSDFQREIDQYIKQNDIHFRKNFEMSAIKITQFCNGL